MQDEYISASQLGRMLNLSRGSIYNMRKRGELPQGIRIGGCRRWNMAEIRSFLKGGVTV